MKLLRYFNHENIISILDIQKPRNYESFNEVYLIQVWVPHVVGSNSSRASTSVNPPIGGSEASPAKKWSRLQREALSIDLR